MIHRTADTWQGPRWQNELTDLIRSPAELIELLELDPALLPSALAAAGDFALRVPRPYAMRIRKGDAHDPLLRQVLPLGDELLAAPGYSADPLQEKSTNPVPGLIHKYPGRVLLIVSGSCAINCRYCFRRHFPYQDNNPGRAAWQRALDYIAADSSITEVIYSGGDPLSAPDRHLTWLTQAVEAIAHVRRLRIHSRLPVVIPSRIDDECLSWMTNHRLDTSLVIHSNHANEIDAHLAEALGRVRAAGITLLNQTVLLKGVNDSLAALHELSERLFACGVLPYYLHLLDKVTGAQHFDLPVSRALELHQGLRDTLPGYLVPKLVREVPGAHSKTPVV
ncbi:EF-P beta-lysylation protein EpmB [Marinimicrobium sp. ABcell2]|uniref:EF-P beta-lysylation protein EpmB n=1 Tax=Marinimicrobium sp. ABcell2 TaxID=3069751 RepID=UPI0027AE11CD|nr:EF-P beta-lysylation protein EpmB [Marinimicrobium sp. ABcell2]MDQ2076470.1 EF-P beta-lysylation protein EpmB [Marinimicrobium sp. ABcell2]